MLELYIIRHGQTDYNLRNIVQGGGVDSSLNEEGHRQARLFFDYYKEVPFQAVIHTSLQRTKQTVEPFRALDLKFVEMPELDELNWGIIEGREATGEVTELFNSVSDAWIAGNVDARMEGGESAQECADRVLRGLDMIQSMFPAGGKVLVCTHGRTLRVLLSLVTGYGLPKMNIFPHHNTSLNLVHFSPDQGYILHKLNDTTHLN